MATDPSIYGLVGRGVKSVADYDREALDLENARTSQQANKLALLLNKQKADEYVRGVGEQNRLRALTQGWRGDTSDDQRVVDLKNAGFFTQADALEKALMERQKTGAGVKETEAKTTKELADAYAKTAQNYRAQLDLVQGPEQAAQWLRAQYEDPVFGKHMQSLGTFEKAVTSIPTDPAGFSEWRARAGLGMEKFIQDQTSRRGQDITAETSRTNTAATNARMAAEGAANRAVTMRGQDKTDARQRDLNEITKTDKEAIRKEAANEKAVTKFADTLQKDGIPEIEAALQGAEAIFSKYSDPKTGKIGAVPGIGPIKNALPDWAVSSEGKDVRESMQAVANIVLSARSGAAVTDQELRRLARELSNSVGAGADDMQRAYGKFRTRFEQVKANLAAGVSEDVKRAYEERGGIKIKRGGAEAPSPIKSGTDLGGGFVVK